MHELELIPPEYRTGLRVRRWIIRGLWGLLLLSMALVLSAVLLSQRSSRIEASIAAIQGQQKHNQLQQNELVNLIKRQIELQREVRFLQGLRSGVAVPALLTAVDQALATHPIWFQDWSFSRASTLVNKPPAASNQGYFIVLNAPGSPSSSQVALKLDTNMSIRGQSVDHLALSHFLRQLAQLPAVAEVSLNRTTLRRYINSEVLDFELSVRISNGEGP